MSGPDAEDQSWSMLDPVYAAQHGIRVVADYLSHDPSKDWTAPQIRAYHAAGVAAMFLWETNANRALSGYMGGLADGRDAGNELTSLIAQVGYSPATPIAVIAACDFDTNPSQYAVINGYYQGFRDGLAGRAMSGAYGEADLLDELGALVDVDFQTYAWSQGRVSARADLYQYLNGQTLNGAVVDFDRIINDSQLGAWWPPGHEPSGDGTPLGDDVGNVDTFSGPALQAIQDAVWNKLVSGGLASDVLAVIYSNAKTPAAVDVNVLAAALAPLLKVGASKQDVVDAIKSTIKVG